MFLLPAHAQTPAALTGQVSSAEEGMMEGVVVSAKKDGSTISISVEILRCKSAQMVRKEVGAFFLAYNLIRAAMAQAASTAD